MTSDDIDANQTKRAEQDDAVLDEALRRPGVYDMMRVYGAWKGDDGRLDTHGVGGEDAWFFTTTDRAV